MAVSPLFTGTLYTSYTGMHCGLLLSPSAGESNSTKLCSLLNICSLAVHRALIRASCAATRTSPPDDSLVVSAIVSGLSTANNCNARRIVPHGREKGGKIDYRFITCEFETRARKLVLLVRRVALENVRVAPWSCDSHVGRCQSLRQIRALFDVAASRAMIRRRRQVDGEKEKNLSVRNRTRV
ncbi:unnamed protein product [Trichogramma brassicae]|uniref:Uncharacterized protein n=1 Tax=Trichogramma brassicae TaxID=86971 RepID=A0A6H5IA01_9HYME|nr:unnamed protein product [Trichogramma brassicae]